MDLEYLHIVATVHPMGVLAEQEVEKSIYVDAVAVVY